MAILPLIVMLVCFSDAPKSFVALQVYLPVSDLMVSRMVRLLNITADEEFDVLKRNKRLFSNFQSKNEVYRTEVWIQKLYVDLT